MTHRPPRARLSLTLPIALAVCGPWAAAQALPDAGQLLREQVPRPERAAPELPRLQVPEPAPKPAAAAGGVRFRVDTVVLQGHGAFTTDALLALVADLPGEQRTLADAEDAARRITAHYRARGYPVARAYVPAQDVTDGRLRIEVIEGRVDRVVLDSGTDVHRTYDGTTDATGATAVVTGGQLFGTDTLASGSFAFTDRHAGSGKTVTVNGVVIDDGNGGANYTLTVADNTTSSIAAAPVTVSGTDVHRSYDGTTDAMGATTVVTGGQLFGTDTLAGGSFAFADRHAGTGKTVVLGGVAINDGNGGANYALTVVNNTGSSITAAPLQITADATDKTYDGTTDAQTGWRVSGGQLFGTDAIGSVALAFDSRHAGTGKSLVLGGAVLNDGNGGGNYALTLAPQAGSRIAAAPLQITADPAHKTFDGTTEARTTWRVSAGRLFGTDTVGDVGLRYDSAAVGVGKRLHLAGVALNDGNGGANYSVTLADNTGSSIRLSSVENARLEQVAANARSTVAPGAGSGPGFGSLVPRALSAGSAPIVLVDCGQRLPADLVADDCR